MRKFEIKYIGGLSGVDIDGIGTVKRGDKVMAPEALAKELVERRPSEWEWAGDKKSKKKKGVE